MALIPTPYRVEQMIRQAMQDKAPQMYATLSASNALDAEVEDRLATFESQMSDAMNDALNKSMLNPDAEEAILEIDRDLRAATENALAIVLEFPEG